MRQPKCGRAFSTGLLDEQKAIAIRHARERRDFNADFLQQARSRLKRCTQSNRNMVDQGFGNRAGDVG